MQVNAQGKRLVTVLMAALIGVFSLNAPGISPPVWAEHPGSDPAPVVAHRRLPEADPSSCLKPSSEASTSPEFADYDPEGSDDDEKQGHCPGPAFGELPRRPDANRPRRLPGVAGLPTLLASVPLFLLCQRLMC